MHWESCICRKFKFGRSTGLTVNLNGAGSNVGAKASAGGSIVLNDSNVSFAPGGGGNTGLLATGAGSQIVTNSVISDDAGGRGW